MNGTPASFKHDHTTVALT
uniref:Uncharacterized protein n=1 Tax=Anguilla anguilla TaxID=7936 RepID=A0A0E9RQD8_ANGAN